MFLLLKVKTLELQELSHKKTFKDMINSDHIVGKFEQMKNINL